MIPHRRNRLIAGWFDRHAGSLLRKNFRKISLTAASRVPVFEKGVPAVVIGNHSSWWDPLLGFYLSRFLFKRPTYGIMAEEQLRRYGIFRFLGVFSVDRNGDLGEAREFLTYARDVIRGRDALLWIYPQGELLSNDSPLDLKSGFARILCGFERVHLLRVFSSYDFWIESKPEIVIDVPPLETFDRPRGSAFVDELVARTSSDMTARLAELKRIVRERDSAALKPLFVRDAGTHPVYDLWRQARALAAGEAFSKRHGGA